MATLKAGGYVVPMDPEFPTERLAMYAEDTQVHSIITTTTLQSRAEAFTTAHVPQILLIDDGSLQNALKGILPSKIDPESIAYVEFTSGSTGRPKGVIVQHHCLASYCASIRDMYSLTPNDCALLLTSINFDPFVRQTFLPLYIGARVVIARPGGHLDADYIMELAATHGVTIMHSVPTLALQYYAASAAARCTALRYIGSGGEPLPQQLVDLVHTLNNGKVVLYNNYGPTECTVSCTCKIGVKPGDIITVGGPDINMAAYVVDAHMQPVPVGVPGELLISGPRLAQGYIGRPDLTAAAFIPNPLYELMAPSIPEEMRRHFTKAYRTGDLVRWRNDGTLVCMGRIDRQVKITGVRIELGEVEAALESAENVAQAMAAAVPDSNGHKRLVGYVTPETLDPGAVLAHCRSVLVPAMVPTAIVALESFPLLPNGKVDVRSLPAPDWSFQANLLGTFGEDDGPLDEHTAAVIDTIRQVLGLNDDVRVPLKAELFDLGATSVQVASLVGRIRKQMDVNLEMRQIYLNPQIEFLCKEVRKQKEGTGASNAKKPTSASLRHRPLGYPIAVWAKAVVQKSPIARLGTALVQLIGVMVVFIIQFGSIAPG
jgi:amino acid adenylation domain-containing protein